jgi:UDP-N-acetylmuramate--alanine ligase
MGRVRNVHFVGIGGAGMGGIAEVLHNLGYTVSGSDLRTNAMCERLQRLGIAVRLGHAARHVAQADVVVTSTAVQADNPEVEAARGQNIVVVPRAEMLAELMRFKQGIAIAGTHGKTTTTSLVASLFARGGFDPTFVIGGLLNSTGTHARLGEGEYLVAEADESDASFLHLKPMLAVVTNIDLDHMETYDGEPDRLYQAFADFLHHLPFYGLAIVCGDDAGVQRLLPRLSRRHRTYGFYEGADYHCTNVQQDGPRMRFDLTGPESSIAGLNLNLAGRHNVANAAAAVAVAMEVGVDETAIRSALESFEGIGRRFQIYGEVSIGDKQILLVDDYGHHPREVGATLEAARASWPHRRLVLAFQLHRYTRTRDLFEDFAVTLSDVDALVLVDVYAAGETHIVGADGRSMARAIRNRGMVDPIFVEQPDLVPGVLPGVLEDGDVLLLSGAGSIGGLAPMLAGQA